MDSYKVLNRIHTSFINNIIELAHYLLPSLTNKDIKDLELLYCNYSIVNLKNYSSAKLNNFFKIQNESLRKIVRNTVDKLSSSDLESVYNELLRIINNHKINEKICIDKDSYDNIINNIKIINILIETNKDIFCSDIYKLVITSFITFSTCIILSSVIKNIYKGEAAFLIEYKNIELIPDKKEKIISLMKMKQYIINILSYKFIPSLYVVYVNYFNKKIKDIKQKNGVNNISIEYDLEIEKFNDIRKMIDICRQNNNIYSENVNNELYNIISKYGNNPKDLLDISVNIINNKNELIGGGTMFKNDLEKLKNDLKQELTIKEINERGYSKEDVNNLLNMIKDSKIDELIDSGVIQLDKEYVNIKNDILSKQNKELLGDNITSLTLEEIFGTKNIADLVYNIYKNNFGNDVNKDKLALHILKKINDYNNGKQNNSVDFTQSGNENKNFDDNSFGFTSADIQLIMILETLETLRQMCCSANSSNKISNHDRCGEVSYTDKTNPNITVNVYKDLESLDVDNNSIKLNQ